MGVEIWLGPASEITAAVLGQAEKLGQRLFEGEKDKMNPKDLILGGFTGLAAVFYAELGELFSDGTGSRNRQLFWNGHGGDESGFSTNLLLKKRQISTMGRQGSTGDTSISQL